MSEFDDNPFADPFAEPSIRQATQNNPVNSNTLAEYDPFSSPPIVSNTTTAPAVVTPTNITSNAPPPTYTQSAQQQITSDDFQRRQEELEIKAQELARREEELRQQGSGVRVNNWPPLPANCPVAPCFYQDINVDIPLEFQKIVRMLYYLWMFHALMLLLNVLGGLALFISLGSGSTFGLAVLYMILFTPLSFLCWFRPVYKAFRSDSSFNFMVFFFVFFFQFLFAVGQAVGVPSVGACGWVGVGQAFNAGAAGTGVFLVLVALGSTVIAASMGIILLWVHRIYRGTGASFAKAQAEFAQGVMRNEHVQTMASNAASAAVRSQFAQSPTSTTASATSEPRF